jgi:hypothetical protein
MSSSNLQLTIFCTNLHKFLEIIANFRLKVCIFLRNIESLLLRKRATANEGIK